MREIDESQILLDDTLKVSNFTCFIIIIVRIYKCQHINRHNIIKFSLQPTVNYCTIWHEIYIKFNIPNYTAVHLLEW